MRIFGRTSVHVVMAIAALLVPRAATGDPIGITSGTVTVDVFSGLSRLQIEGEGFVLTAGAEAFTNTLGLSCIPCAPGTTLDLGGAFHGPRASGSAVVDGVTYSEIFLDGMTGVFSSPSFQIAGTQGVTVTRDFSFSGTISGYLLNPFVHGLTEPAFTKTLFGRGTATGTFSFNGDEQPLFFAEQLRYDFTAASPSPTPEPASLLLLGTGAALVALRRRRAQTR